MKRESIIVMRESLKQGVVCRIVFCKNLFKFSLRPPWQHRLNTAVSSHLSHLAAERGNNEISPI
jgi:hypothetical protein